MLGAILVTAMLLSAWINNAAAAILMAPIGIEVAETLGASADPFLMAVATAMLLSAWINNAAAAILMAPIGIEVAETLGASADPFLMAVAIGASISGHQSADITSATIGGWVSRWRFSWLSYLFPLSCGFGPWEFRSLELPETGVAE